MNKFLAPLIVLPLLSSLLISCGGGDNTPIAIEFDKDIDKAAKSSITRDLKALRKIDSYQDLPNPYFNLIFGGTSGEAVLQYITDRVKYVIPESTLDTLVESADVLNWEPFQESTKVATMAYNIGAGIYLSSLFSQKKYALEINKKTVTIDNTRVGLMATGEGYENKDIKELIKLVPEFGQGIIAHEARHSDCALIPSDEEIKTVRAKRLVNPDTALDSLENRTCGYLHSPCPKGHIYEGLLACDKMPWGAYSVSAIFNEGSFNNLVSRKKGSEQRLAILQALTLDYYSRLDLDTDALLKGELGAPNMIGQPAP